MTHSCLSSCVLSVLFIVLLCMRLFSVSGTQECDISRAYYPAGKTVPNTPTQIMTETSFSKDNALAVQLLWGSDI